MDIFIDLINHIIDFFSFIHWKNLSRFMVSILSGGVITIGLALSALPFGLAFGLVGAFFARSKFYGLRIISRAYAGFIRGFPELLLILILYFWLPSFINNIFYDGEPVLFFPPFVIGCLALSLIFGGYATRVFYGALNAVHDGQIEAARAIGMRKASIFWRIQWPQMWRYALPGIGNLWLVLMKDTALVSLIELKEIMKLTRSAADRTNDPLTFFLFAACLYLLLALISEWLISKFEAHQNKKMTIGGAS